MLPRLANNSTKLIHTWTLISSTTDFQSNSHTMLWIWSSKSNVHLCYTSSYLLTVSSIQFHFHHVTYEVITSYNLNYNLQNTGIIYFPNHWMVQKCWQHITKINISVLLVFWFFICDCTQASTILLNFAFTMWIMEYLFICKFTTPN